MRVAELNRSEKEKEQVILRATYFQISIFIKYRYWKYLRIYSK
ncbi:hypothetical protein MmTuc01_1210 [Methanosarcina mazei Tuc01]|uniref:Uncharacterized protein n=1 Tax=Methanosarcina mazei Tuc01 TaxID=1236903 RepID=M1P839_METMZ|nr:hypothetical protein MmTuc01_1210 [Methanosarcina mazei Tuc01]